jgi:hypothetical protein
MEAAVGCIFSDVPRVYKDQDRRATSNFSFPSSLLLMLCSVPPKPGNRLRTPRCGLAFQKQTGVFLLESLFNAGNHREA